MDITTQFLKMLHPVYGNFVQGREYALTKDETIETDEFSEPSEPINTGEQTQVNLLNWATLVKVAMMMTKTDLATDSFEEEIETTEQGLIGPSESSSSTDFRKFS